MTTDIHSQVAIIGGGLSGLYAAHLLQQRGIQATVYEARDRLGGRIVSLPSTNPTPGLTDNSERFDLGPSWFWPDLHPLMANLIEQLNLTAFPQYQSGAHLFDRGRGQPPQRHELGIATQPISMRLSGGMLSLVEALAATLDDNNVQLNHQVTAITQQDDNTLSLNFDTPEGSSTVTAQQVILAFPLRLIPHINLTPALPEQLIQHCHNTMTWMAAHAKFVAVYDQPFWRQQGLSGSASSQAGPLVEIHDASSLKGKAALFGFVGVNAAARKTAGRDTVIDVTLKQLTDLFGEQAAKPSDVFLVDWSQENFTATEQDQLGANSHPIYGIPSRLLPVWQDKLIIAGTESDSQAGGYLEGALSAALRAAQAITK